MPGLPSPTRSQGFGSSPGFGACIVSGAGTVAEAIDGKRGVVVLREERMEEYGKRRTRIAAARARKNMPSYKANREILKIRLQSSSQPFDFDMWMSTYRVAGKLGKVANASLTFFKFFLKDAIFSYFK